MFKEFKEFAMRGVAAPRLHAGREVDKMGTENKKALTQAGKGEKHV